MGIRRVSVKLGCDFMFSLCAAPFNEPIPYLQGAETLEGDWLQDGNEYNHQKPSQFWNWGNSILIYEFIYQSRSWDQAISTGKWWSKDIWVSQYAKVKSFSRA